MGKFFEADAAIFNRCDDSNGNIGDVFRFTAANQFVSFVRRQLSWPAWRQLSCPVLVEKNGLVFYAIFLPITFSFDFNNGGVVDNAVNSRKSSWCLEICDSID